MAFILLRIVTVAKQQSVQSRIELVVQPALEFVGLKMQVGIVSIGNFVPPRQPFIPLSPGHEHVECFRQRLGEFPVGDSLRLLLPAVASVKIKPGFDGFARRLDDANTHGKISRLHATSTLSSQNLPRLINHRTARL